MDKDNEVKKERKYYTSGPGKPPIFIQAILYEKKMSAIDFFHLTDACLDWEKQGDDIAVLLSHCLLPGEMTLFLRSMIPWQSFYIR